jgi:hypothetical protein
MFWKLFLRVTRACLGSSRGIICLLGLGCLSVSAYAAQPPRTLPAKLGQVVRLPVGVAVDFPAIGVSLRLVGVEFTSCSRCITGPRQAVYTELTHRGIVYPQVSAAGSWTSRTTPEGRIFSFGKLDRRILAPKIPIISPPLANLGRYRVAVHSSDLKAFAELELIDREQDCQQRTATDSAFNERCWSNLAILTGETSYCSRLQEKDDQSHCVEGVAWVSSDPRLCKEVESPAYYCVWRRAVETFDVSLCPRFMRACYRALGLQAKGDVSICNVLNTKERTSCISAIKDLSAGADPNASSRHVVVGTDGTALVQGSVKSAGVFWHWKCYRDRCEGYLKKTSSPEQVCGSLPERIGKVVSLTVGDKRLTEVELQRCNALNG